MRVSACPRCGSLDMRPPTVSDGVALGGGETVFLVCHDCQFRGAAVAFDDEAAYEAFLAGKEGWSDGDDEGWAEERQDKEVAGMLETKAPRRPRGTATFVGVVGVLLMAFGGLTTAFSEVNLVGLFVGLLTLGIGLAFVRIAVRMWRGASPS